MYSEVLDLKPTRELAEKSGSFVTNFSQADSGRGGWEGDISYDADFLASLRLGDLAFPSRASPIRTLSRRDAKPQRFSKAILIGLIMLEFSFYYRLLFFIELKRRSPIFVTVCFPGVFAPWRLGVPFLCQTVDNPMNSVFDKPLAKVNDHSDRSGSFLLSVGRFSPCGLNAEATTGFASGSSQRKCLDRTASRALSGNPPG